MTDSTASSLGIFVIATSLAQVLSSPVWGRFSDRSSRTVMMLGGGTAVVAGMMALLFDRLPPEWQHAYLYAAIFLLLGIIAQAGVRLGRKTYLVDAAPAAERPLYVAVSNTLIGILTLAGGALGLIGTFLGIHVLLFIFIGLAILGVIVSWQMPEADQMFSDPRTTD